MDGLLDLKTESNNQASVNIDCMSPLEIVQLMNLEDACCVSAVAKEAEQIAKGITLIDRAFQKGGRLLYFGCGTSGRLGVLDASECPPTFGTPPEMVLGVIAGGDTALRSAVENAEDNDADGEVQAARLQVGDKDVLTGISASGRSPFVLGAMRYARRAGAATIGLSNNHHCEMASFSDVLIAPEVGPEVVQGSTRLKAGTAQKMVLNMLSTGAMIRIGKVYRNMMVDMMPTNQKLHIRAIRLVEQSTGCSEQVAQQALEGCGYHVKTAIVMVLTGRSAEESRNLLDVNGGYVRRTLEQEGVASTDL